MKIRMQNAVLAAAVVAAALTGCSKPSRNSSASTFERSELVSRFFDSVRHERFAEAANQGRKLYEMDRNNEFLLHLITIHESNDFLRKAQEELNSGNVDAALQILDQGIAKYPQNRTLRASRTKVSQLRNAKSLIAAMKNAKGEAAMSAALTAAETGLGTNMSHNLGLYFKRYEAKIKQVALEDAAMEKKRIEAEKAHKRIEAEKIKKHQNMIPPEPTAKLPPLRSGTGRKGVSASAQDSSYDRPPPEPMPESENKE